MFEVGHGSVPGRCPQRRHGFLFVFFSIWPQIAAVVVLDGDLRFTPYLRMLFVLLLCFFLASVTMYFDSFV
jgi:hypothetical protein